MPGSSEEESFKFAGAYQALAALALNIPWKQSTLTLCLSVKSRMWCATAELNGTSIRRITDSCVCIGSA